MATINVTDILQVSGNTVLDIGGGTFFGNYVCTGADTITSTQFRLVVQNNSGGSQGSGTVNWVCIACK